KRARRLILRSRQAGCSWRSFITIWTKRCSATNSPDGLTADATRSTLMQTTAPRRKSSDSRRVKREGRSNRQKWTNREKESFSSWLMPYKRAIILLIGGNGIVAKGESNPVLAGSFVRRRRDEDRI